MSGKRHRELPRLVVTWLMTSRAWLVGSAARWYIGETDEKPNDVDVVVPPDLFHDVCKTVPPGALIGLSTFGALKLKLDGVEVDVIPMTLDRFIECCDGGPGVQVAYRRLPRAIVRWSRSE